MSSIVGTLTHAKLLLGAAEKSDDCSNYGYHVISAETHQGSIAAAVLIPNPYPPGRT